MYPVDSVVDLSNNWALGGVRQEHSTLTVRPPTSDSGLSTIMAVDKLEGFLLPFYGFASVPVVLDDAVYPNLEKIRQKNIFFLATGL